MDSFPLDGRFVASLFTQLQIHSVSIPISDHSIFFSVIISEISANQG